MIALPEQDLSSLDDFVARQESKNLLRFIVCGSVDHGKSTLIGRLLYESKLLLDDQLDALAKASRSHGTQGGSLDLALVLDGLAAEREQKITIDVAYRFFTTERRKFIVADTPGHEQYTRNMATGASTADLALLVVSGEGGLTGQTKRHLLIISALGVRQIVVAVNKMDLVGWSQSKFAALEADLHAFTVDLDFDEVALIPVAAAKGDNVVSRSNHMGWYGGPTLLDYLEQVRIPPKTQGGAFRMPVQWVNRPDPDFRGYSGLIAGGEVHPDMPVQILPSGQWARVERIVTADGDLDRAVAGQAVTLTLAGEIDASRGDVIAEIGAPAPVTNRLSAQLVWMGEEPLTPGRPYLFKLAACTATVTLEPGLCVFDLDTRQSTPADCLPINGIGWGVLELDRRIAADRYADNKETGSFILIHPESYDTVGMGMVIEVLDAESAQPPRISAVIADLIRSTESHARSIAKAASWRMTGSLDTFIIAAFITGSPKAAGAVALTEILTKTALYYFHERIWILGPMGETALRNSWVRNPTIARRRAIPSFRSLFGVTHMQKNLVNGAARPNARCALDKARIAKTWQQYYKDRGYELWGFSPSPAARILAQAILNSNPRRSERIEIVDWGCGYGRDSLYFVELGFDVIGIDVSAKAVALARGAYKQRQASGIPLLGSASFHAGDLHSVFKSRTGQRVRAFFSNRVLHLLGEIDFREATHNAMTCMEKGAYFCVSARSPDDFNTALMEWIPGKEQEMARYKDPVRSGHEISFVTKDRFLQAVGNDLEDMHYTKATEPERMGSSDTHLLILLGRKRGPVSDAGDELTGNWPSIRFSSPITSGC